MARSCKGVRASRPASASWAELLESRQMLSASAAGVNDEAPVGSPRMLAHAAHVRHVNHLRHLRAADRAGNAPGQKAMPAAVSASRASVLRPDHVIVVMEEDRFDNAIGDTANMPYVNQLASTGLVFNNSHGLNTSSQDGEMNYLALYSGSTQGVTDDGSGYSFSGANLASSLNTVAGLSFAGYSESLPSDGSQVREASDPASDPANHPDLYVRNYNPMAMFTNAGPGKTNADVNKTFAEFPTNFASLPTVSLVVPNTLHSTHGSNEAEPWATDPGAYVGLRQAADTWLRQHLDAYAQWAKTHNSLLIVTTDEADRQHPGNGSLTTIVTGDPRLFVAGTDSTSVTHYDVLRTIEDMYGLTPLGNSGAAAGLDVNAQGQLAAPTTTTTLTATTTSVLTSPNPSTAGQTVTFTATVASQGAGTPTGTVQFVVDGANFGTPVAISNGVATLATAGLASGTHTVSASYSGDANFSGSTSSAVTQTVQAAAVSNDLFANRTAISGSSITATGTNSGATKEAGEPNHAGNTGGKSVWWTWTAPSSGGVTIDTSGSSFDTLLGVYTGTSVSALTQVAANDDSLSGGTATSKVTFNATAGTTYQIAVDGYGGAAGSITLHVNLGAAVGAANDNFANRTAITGKSATVSGSNVGATKETGEPSHAGNAGGKSVWWTWTAPAAGTVTLDTLGSSFDTLLGVYTGSSVSALTQAAANDDSASGGTTTSKLTFKATAGKVYQIAVDGYGGASGSITMHLTLA